MSLRGKETGTTAAVKDTIVVNGITLTRANFGPSNFGEIAWNLIRGGGTCEAIIDASGTKCGKQGIGTTDYDVLGDPELRIHCSQEHHYAIMNGVRADLTRIGRTTAFGTNGFGRTKA